MRKLLVVIFLLSTSFMSAQYQWDYGFNFGASNYLGDIGGKEKTRRDFVMDMKLAQTRWAVNGFVRYKFNNKLSLKGQLAYQRVQGDDALSTNPARHYRNLSFRDDIFELSVTPQLALYENTDLGSSYRFRLAFKFYVFAGLGVFHMNPKTQYNGDWVALRPLQTEGIKYSLWQLDVPVGTGFYFTMKKKHRIGFEFNWRICFTDYIDDVSKNYISHPAGSEAAALTDRTDHAAANAYKPGFGNNFGVYTKPDGEVHNNKRGQSNHKDTYMSMTLNYSYVRRGHSSFYRSRYGSFFKKRRRSRARKVRAKF